jgi:hypothetical protein
LLAITPQSANDDSLPGGLFIMAKSCRPARKGVLFIALIATGAEIPGGDFLAPPGKVGRLSDKMRVSDI